LTKYGWLAAVEGGRKNRKEKSDPQNNIDK
jgi:hypothetical protein